MHTIRYTRQSEIHLNQIFDYIAEDNPYYAQEVLSRIRHSIRYLEHFPYIGTAVGDELRHIVEPQYRYKIVYRVIDEYVDILAVYKYQKDWQ